MTYSYHPHARRELDDAADFYDSIDLKLGDDFLEEIDDCICRILMFPLAWTKLHGSVRRCRIHEEVRVLEALLATKPPQANLGHVLAKARGEEGCSAAMPFLPMWEACQAFAGHVRYVNFKNGQGVFFLTQWDTETEQISNDGLEYAYQGITNDGRYWVLC